MKTKLTTICGILAACFFLNSCSLFQNDPVEISQLIFSRAEFYEKPYKAYKAGEPLVLTASVNLAELDNKPRVVITTSSGRWLTVKLNTLNKISDKQLAGAIRDHEGYASVTIKETNRKRAYEPGVGYTTSEETVQKMRNWLNSIEDVQVSLRVTSAPVFSIRMKPTREIVNLIRESKNVEIIEPEYRLFTLDNTMKSKIKSVNPEYPVAIMSVIFTSGDSAQLQVQPGDTITAMYEQPNGTVLEAQTTIK